MKKPLSRARPEVNAAHETPRGRPRGKKRSVVRPDSTRERIYAQVRKIPRGRVATYGQIASLSGLDGHARQVGYAMAALPSHSAVPWHRVINAQGRVSMRREGPGGSIIQQQMLEREGVIFDGGGRVSLARFGWKPSRNPPPTPPPARVRRGSG